MTLSLFISPLTTLVTVVLGLGVWRYQLIEKRRYEIAEQALTVASKVAASLHQVRRAEADADALILLHPEMIRAAPWYATYMQLQGSEAEAQSFSDAVKGVAMHFGNEAAAPLSQLQALRARVASAHSRLFYQSEKAAPTARQLDEWKCVVSQGGDDDPIARQIDELDKKIQKQFDKYLRPSFWGLLLPFWRRRTFV